MLFPVLRKSIIDSAQQVAQAAPVTRFNGQVNQQAQRVSRRRLLSEQENVGGIAEAVLKGIAPGLLEGVRDSIVEVKAPEPPTEKTQEQAKLQERPKQHQKKRVKERDGGMEL